MALQTDGTVKGRRQKVPNPVRRMGIPWGRTVPVHRRSRAPDV